MTFEFTEKSEDRVGIEGEGKFLLIHRSHVVGMGVQVRGSDYQVILNTTQGHYDSLQAVVDQLRSYLLGWKAYFGLAQTPATWRDLDGWIRRRLRALQLKQWRRGTTIYRELTRLGASPRVAQSVAALSRRWWHNSLSAIHRVLTTAYFDSLGLPRLA